MFTGIVETLGRVVELERGAESARLVLEAAELGGSMKVGDSLAVNGTCLTVTSQQGGRLTFDVVLQTLELSALGRLAVGSSVNLERAMRADGRFDGHIVQGHVDATGRVRELRRGGDDVRLFVDCSEEFANLLVDKGSVTIDGVALTVVEAGAKGFEVALIPHTLAETTLGEAEPGTPVNLEADVLGKYVRSYLARVLPEARGGRGQ